MSIIYFIFRLICCAAIGSFVATGIYYRTEFISNKSLRAVTCLVIFLTLAFGVSPYVSEKIKKLFE